MQLPHHLEKYYREIVLIFSLIIYIYTYCCGAAAESGITLGCSQFSGNLSFATRPENVNRTTLGMCAPSPRSLHQKLHDK
jgi:hypothetical protein